MSEKFEDLKQKLQNVDVSQAKVVIQQIRDARKSGQISEDEEHDLMDLAGNKLGDIDLDNLGES